MTEPIDMSKGYPDSPSKFKEDKEAREDAAAFRAGGYDPSANTTPKTTTLGEDRVGIKFNPSDISMVYAIKSRAAELIDLIAQINDDSADGKRLRPEVTDEVRRCRALAQTAIEDGAMWAVKAATKHLT